MIIKVNRKYKKSGYTIGTLTIDGEYICDTLEPQDRGLFQTMPLEKLKKIKVKRETAIPTGTYVISFRYSNHFKGRRAFLECVPGFEGVMIHEGNTKKDTEGCILVGWNKKKGMVKDSCKALGIVNERIINALDKGEVVIVEIS